MWDAWDVPLSVLDGEFSEEFEIVPCLDDGEVFAGQATISTSPARESKVSSDSLTSMNHQLGCISNLALTGVPAVKPKEEANVSVGGESVLDDILDAMTSSARNSLLDISFLGHSLSAPTATLSPAYDEILANLEAESCTNVQSSMRISEFRGFQDDVLTWLRSVKDEGTKQRWNDSVKLSVARSFLRNSALAWQKYDGWRHVQWKDWCQELVIAFGNSPLLSDYQPSSSLLPNSDTFTTESYLTDFQREARRHTPLQRSAWTNNFNKQQDESWDLCPERTDRNCKRLNCQETDATSQTSSTTFALSEEQHRDGLDLDDACMWNILPFSGTLDFPQLSKPFLGDPGWSTNLSKTTLDTCDIADCRGGPAEVNGTTAPVTASNKAMEHTTRLTQEPLLARMAKHTKNVISTPPALRPSITCKKSRRKVMTLVQLKWKRAKDATQKKETSCKNVRPQNVSKEKCSTMNRVTHMLRQKKAKKKRQSDKMLGQRENYEWNRPHDKSSHGFRLSPTMLSQEPTSKHGSTRDQQQWHAEIAKPVQVTEATAGAYCPIGSQQRENSRTNLWRSSNRVRLKVWYTL